MGFSTVLYCTVQYNEKQHKCIVLYYTVQYCTRLFRTAMNVLFSTVLYCAILFSIVLCSRVGEIRKTVATIIRLIRPLIIPESGAVGCIYSGI